MASSSLENSEIFLGRVRVSQAKRLRWGCFEQGKVLEEARNLTNLKN